MDSIRDLLQHKVDQLDLGRQSELSLIQVELDRLFPGKEVRATKIDRQQRKLVVTVSSSSVATVVRYSQLQLLATIKDISQPPIEKINLRLV